MEEDNIIKKKNKNYYQRHNHTKNYYYKNKRKKKNLIAENNDSEEVGNILLYNNEVNKETNEEVPERKIVQVIKENSIDYEEMDLAPKRKEKKGKSFFGNKIFRYGLSFAVLIIAIVGVSYSYFNYRREDGRQGDIIAGDVYVKLEESAVNMTLNKMYPRTAEEARARNDNYIDFTIKAKNTSETKEITYTINITNGENVAGKTRIDPQYLLVDLQEVNGNNYTYIKESVPLSSFSFRGIVPVNTNSEITKVYRLRVWVSDSIIISDTETNATHTQAQFANLYGSLQIEVNSEDRTKVPTGEEQVREAITAKINAETNSCNPVWVDDNGTANDETDDITYFSGTNDCVDMNYVWYSGKLWRITAIYPDGSMKLVTQNNITSIAFNESGQVNFYTDANSTSYMYQWLNEDFYDTLYNANQIIDTTKQWNATMPADTNVSTKPLETNMVTANVGLLNSYEYYNSYRLGSVSNGYLNIGYYWWLLNPYNASSVWFVYNGGSGSNTNPTGTRGGRPSIYLKPGLEFTGDGTSDTPYRIVRDKDTGTSNELINTRISGEYVKLKNGNNEQLFRIIGIKDNKTKIIAMDYAENKNTRQFATSTGSANTLWGSGTTTGTDTWYGYLNRVDSENITNTGYYDNLERTYGALFDIGIYQLGTSGYNYKNSICPDPIPKQGNECAKEFKIGLSRYGEMFATQQARGYSNSTTMWLMNRYSASVVWYVGNYGNGVIDYPTGAYGARPTLHLKSTVKILSGSGTQNDPYVVGL